MSEWIKVVTHPLGLAGFVLFLVFGALGKIKSKDERRWLAPAAFGLAAVCLLGCVLLAYQQTSAQQTSGPGPGGTPQQATKSLAQSATADCALVSQSSTGAGSPNVNCVNGSVTINVDQSSGTKAAPQAAARPPSAEQPANVKR